jgi:hypothetical protein
MRNLFDLIINCFRSVNQIKPVDLFNFIEFVTSISLKCNFHPIYQTVNF